MAIMMATHFHHDGNPSPWGRQPIAVGMATHGQARCHVGACWLTGSPARGRGGVPRVWEGSFLAQLGEAETRVERRFFYSFSPRTFPPETSAERSFLKSFSPHMSCLERQFADVTRGNLRKMAHNGHEGGLGVPVCTRYQPKPARNGIFCHHCAERS